MATATFKLWRTQEDGSGTFQLPSQKSKSFAVDSALAATVIAVPPCRCLLACDRSDEIGRNTPAIRA